MSARWVGSIVVIAVLVCTVIAGSASAHAHNCTTDVQEKVEYQVRTITNTETIVVTETVTLTETKYLDRDVIHTVTEKADHSGCVPREQYDNDLRDAYQQIDFLQSELQERDVMLSNALSLIMVLEERIDQLEGGSMP